MVMQSISTQRKRLVTYNVCCPDNEGLSGTSAHFEANIFYLTACMWSHHASAPQWSHKRRGSPEAQARAAPEMRPRGGHWPLSSTMTAWKRQAVRGRRAAPSSTTP